MLWGALKEIILVAIYLNHSVISLQTALFVFKSAWGTSEIHSKHHVIHSAALTPFTVFCREIFLEIFIVTHTDSAATTIWHVYELNSSSCGCIWRKVCAEGCLWSASRHTSSPPLPLSFILSLPNSHYERRRNHSLLWQPAASLAGRTNGFVQQVCKGKIFRIVFVFLAWGGVEELN